MWNCRDNDWMRRDLLRADTSIEREGGLLLSDLVFPSTDATVDILGERIVLAEAVVVCIVLALGEGDPCLETFWKDSRGARHLRRGSCGRSNSRLDR